MAHFAKIDANNIVVEVIVAEQDFIDSGAVGDPSQWVQTSYNTRGGVHLNGGVPLRANYAVIGGIYDRANDVFYEQKPAKHPSFVISAPTWQWTQPTPKPNDGKVYLWDESLVKWVEKV